jgi:ABC-type branched-subunit amino acid transport system substrate-binding protein
MRGRRHATRVTAALCAAALVASGACTNDDSADGGSGGDSDGGDAASDGTGVTDDAIRLGWPALDQAALVEAGLATDFGDPTAIAQGIVDDWNADGGINGRQVELVTRTYGTDIANLLPEMQATCLDLTEDEQVFATAAFAWFGDAVTCMAGDHGTPLVTMTSLPSTVLETGDDNILLANSTWEEAMRSSVRVLDEAGELGGFERIGVFGPLEPGMQEAIDDGLEPALEEAGTEVAVDGLIPFGVPVDNAAVAAVVSRFKSEDVDAVFAVGSFFYNGAFMTEAQRQDYHPTYVMSDMSEGTDDLILAFAPPEQLANAIGASWKGKVPQPAPTEADHACIDTYAPDARGSVTQEIGAAQICELLELTRQGLEGAGGTPTRGGFVEAMEGIGDFTTSAGGQGSYGPDDHTMPDQVRLVRFDLEGCQCWAFEGDWIDVDG